MGWSSMSFEAPPVGRILCVNLDQLYNVLQALQFASDDCPVRPGASVVDVQDVAIPFGREALRGKRVAEVGRHSFPVAVSVNGVAVQDLSRGVSAS